MNSLIKKWAKDYNCYLTRDNRQMTIERMKRWENYKLKTTKYLLEWPKFWQHQKLTSRWSNRNSDTLLMRMQKSMATLKDRLAVPCKTKQILTVWSSNHIPHYLLMKTYVHIKYRTYSKLLKLKNNQDVLQ